MARDTNKLKVKQVEKLVTPGRHSDGESLYLVIDGEGATMRRRWLYLFNWHGKRREMGLGGFPAVGLAEARNARDEAQRLVREGRDPITARDQAREERAGKPTFGDAADALIEAKGAEWRNEKHKAQWSMTLTTYCASIRSRPVDEIDTEAVLDVLQSIWTAKPETASRLRGRIEAVLDAARARGHIPRNEANPARWRGHLDKLLPKRQKLSRGHHAAMAYADVPAFMASLREREAVAAMALEFCILTATRSGEVLGARWSEIDIEKKVWTVPAGRMKAAREHRVPLSDRALAIVKKLDGAKIGDFVFPGQRPDRPLSVMAMEMVLRRMKVEDVTVHGFRSAFRDWAGNETHFPREIAEAALAHVVGDKAEQAYRRGDALEKRRALMEAWATWCEPRDGSNVVVLKERKAK
jgi:integrase